MTQTTSSIDKLLAQARELADEHCAVDRFDVYDQPFAVYCIPCNRLWPCPPRHLADAVISTLETLAARDTQIRKYGESICRRAAERAGFRADDPVWIDAEMVLNLLDHAKDDA